MLDFCVLKEKCYKYEYLYVMFSIFCKFVGFKFKYVILLVNVGFVDFILDILKLLFIFLK